ncbi:hypothetical protein ACJVDH_06970 [Pedobacter sp. AW1-32]|uniref:hypothetical protein n=1 Tax=Pedobacter sp. AW1-32 TaxID=3383026 RepID=UPI003FEFD320
MQAFDQIQELWQKHEVDVKVSADEMLQQAKKEVNGLRLKSALNIAGMCASFLIAGFSWLFFSYQNWTTHIGFILILMAILTSTILLFRDHRLIAKSDFTVHPNEFLGRLKIYQLNRFKLYNQLYWIYTVALSFGFIFTFIEIIPHLSTIIGIIAIAVTTAWVVFCSTLLRTAVIKKEKEKIGLLIEKFERISAQIVDPE